MEEKYIGFDDRDEEQAREELKIIRADAREANQENLEASKIQGFEFHPVMV